MQARRHRIRQRQRLDSARDWIRSGAKITAGSYARRYGVDRYTAFDDLAALGYRIPEPARRWAQRPPATPRRRAGRRDTEPLDDDSWIMLDGRPFFVAGYTADGAPFGIFADEMPAAGDQ
ncbi:hypothetical protein [Virgisporangium aurantiacum]|uniref:Uncharacterized protein n=1 Tax=Virgisporangium aurantiacum TaxID=175570 RepID=A0A8J3Z699_9ACTN|nr:hypothetical protein [Virgisporangium aurantiacum]GIJ57722.1 hypothetical protein Vau01_052380 [Virgisporangium aurantiacum]